MPADWVRHEVVRQQLVGPNSALWVSAPAAACVLVGSIPSGIPAVCAARAHISELCVGPGMGAATMVVPCVSHDPMLASALPHGHIFVGLGSCGRLPSPWLDPSGVLGSTDISFEVYARGRTDLFKFLSQLSGQVLVCDCMLGDGCHAEVLCRLCAECPDV